MVSIIIDTRQINPRDIVPPNFCDQDSELYSQAAWYVSIGNSDPIVRDRAAILYDQLHLSRRDRNGRWLPRYCHNLSRQRNSLVADFSMDREDAEFLADCIYAYAGPRVKRSAITVC